MPTALDIEVVSNDTILQLTAFLSVGKQGYQVLIVEVSRIGVVLKYTPQNRVYPLEICSATSSAITLDHFLVHLLIGHGHEGVANHGAGFILVVLPPIAVAKRIEAPPDRD